MITIINKTPAIFAEEDLVQAILEVDENPREIYTISYNVGGYYHIYINGKTWNLHRLLANHYFGNCDGYDIHHCDMNKDNNLRSNLLRCTKDEHQMLHGKYETREQAYEARRQHNEEYYKNNREAIRQYNEEYYKNNRETRRQYNEEYYKNNRETIRQQQKQYYSRKKQEQNGGF